jgi:hypothetical protein
MKLYTNESQTAKLIELGFEKTDVSVDTMISTLNGLQQGTLTIKAAFSIGELIEMLPTSIDTGDGYALSIYHNRAEWMVSYDDNGVYRPIYSTEKDELTDALYDMIVKLKEEGVI